MMKHENAYKEAMHYIDNAIETMKQAGIEDKYYLDKKYVHTACGTAYIGMLKALDVLFDIKNVPKKRGRKSIEYYQSSLSKIDKKLLNHLNNGYRLLHIDGYYEGVTNIKAIEGGFDDAITIISALKPYSKNGND